MTDTRDSLQALIDDLDAAISLGRTIVRIELKEIRDRLNALQSGAGDGALPAIGSVADRLVYYADRIVIAEPHLHKGAKFTKWAYQIADDMRNDAAELNTIATEDKL